MSVNSIDAQPFWALIFCCCFLFGFVAAAFLKNIILNLHEYHPQTDSTHTQKAGDVCIRKCISVMLPCTPFSLFTIGVLFYHLHTREKNQSAAAHRHTLWAYGKFEAYRFTIFFSSSIHTRQTPNALVSMISFCFVVFFFNRESINILLVEWYSWAYQTRMGEEFENTWRTSACKEQAIKIFNVILVVGIFARDTSTLNVDDRMNSCDVMRTLQINTFWFDWCVIKMVIDVAPQNHRKLTRCKDNVGVFLSHRFRTI